MSHTGVTGARALVEDTQQLINDLAPELWIADAACAGWRVHDVVTHLGFFLNFIADPDLVLPENPSGTAERLNDAAVVERAGWTTEQVLAYYHQQAAAGLATLEAMQGEQLRDMPLELMDLGTYRLSQLSNAAAFDHLVHLTCDLFAPAGPVPARSIAIEAAIDPALDWMMAGLPQMNRAALRTALERPVGLRLTGVTERSFLIAPDDDGDRVVVHETEDLPTDVATSDALDFLSWGTTRSSWHTAATIEGDSPRVAAFLDAVNVV